MRSVRSQVYPADEIFVVEQPDSEPVESVLRDWNCRFGGKLRYFEQVGSVADSRNRAITATSGDYVTFLDSRDELMPVAFEDHVLALRNSPAAGACYGRVVRRHDCDRMEPSDDSRQPEGFILDWLLGADPVIPLSAFACRRPILESCRFSDAHPGLEWLGFLLQTASTHRFCCVQEDVAIVDVSRLCLKATQASAKCRLLASYAEVAGAPTCRRMLGSLAECERAAALKWLRQGDAQTAREHARAAVALAPWNLRHLLLLGMTEAGTMLPAPKRSDAA